MALQIGAGAPSADLGSDGDYYLQFDTAGKRFFVGPKVSGAWPTNSYRSLQGPTGPFTLHGTGAPSSTLGAQGQGYVDMSTGNTYLKTTNGWGSPVGNILGPQGLAGPSGQSVPSLQSTSNVLGPSFSNATALALSGTPQVIPTPGGAQPGYFIPSVPTTLTSVMLVLSAANSPGATTFSLYEVNTGNTLYSSTVSPAGTVVNRTGLNVGLTTGYVYQWRVTGSGNGFVQVAPCFTQPSTMPFGISYGPQFANSVASTPTTATAFYVPGSSTVTQYWAVPKIGFLYGAAFTNTAGSDATFALYNAANTVVYSTVVPANTTTPLYVGPNTFATNTQMTVTYYTWRVTCPSSGFFSVQPQVFM